MNPVEQQLDFWEELGKLRDTYGLPGDIIWCRLRDENRLPKNKDGKDMNSDEFAIGMKQAIAMLQGGGWRKVLESLREKLNTEKEIA